MAKEMVHSRRLTIIIYNLSNIYTLIEVWPLVFKHYTITPRKSPLLLPRFTLHLAALLELATEDTGDETLGVRIGVEGGGVGQNLRDLEAGAGIGAVGQHAGLERSAHAPNADATALIAIHRLGVGEDNSWGAALSHGGLVDVRGGERGGHVVTGHAEEGDIIADGVL